MGLRLILIVSLLLQMDFALAQCRLDYSNYKLVFSEDFDTVKSVSDLSSHWMFLHDDPGWGWGGDDGEFYDQSQVSILDGGYLRLTAVRQPLPVSVWSDWKKGYRHCNYKSGMIQLRRDLSGYPFDGCKDAYGFTYGMFEVRMKIPKGSAFPAFWLIGPTQFNPFEGKFGSREFGVGYDNEWSTDSITKQHPGQAQWFRKSGSADLADDFHVYTGVWTPDRISFFCDGRELCTFTGDTVSQLQAGGQWCNSNSIIVSMQMPGWSDLQSCNLDVDYIKVFKPVNNDYSLAYKTSSEYLYNDLLGGFGPLPSRLPNSIAVNSNNATQLFYRGEDDKIYIANKAAGGWASKELACGNCRPSSSLGELKYLPLHDILLSIGRDRRVNVFRRSKTDDELYEHEFLYTGEKAASKLFRASRQAGSLHVSQLGEVFIRGAKSDLFRFVFDGAKWSNQILKRADRRSARIEGDMALHEGSGRLFYRARNGKLHGYGKDSGLLFHQGSNGEAVQWGDVSVSKSDGSIIYAPALNSILFIDADNRINKLEADSLQSSNVLPYDYGVSSLSTTGGDLARGSLCWDNDNETLYYVGFDGRIQYLKLLNGSWVHAWVDDYWNTDLHTSFGIDSKPSYAPSLCLGADGPAKSLFYTRRDGHLASFRRDNCETLNPESNAWRYLEGGKMPGQKK